MLKYNIVKPENYSNEHLLYIEKYKKSINLMTSNTNDIIGLKDINSRHIWCSEHYSNIVGLSSPNEVTNKFDFEMSCEGTNKFAEEYVKEDQIVINNGNSKYEISVLNVHNYNDGLKARIFKKKLLFHSDSNSVLGTIYSAYDVELKNFINIIPNYLIKFGAIGDITLNKNYRLNVTCSLNSYEQEICFLLLLNWDFKQIAEFMNKFRPEISTRSPDTIIKKKNYICQKLNINSTRNIDLCEYLISIDFHSKMPISFYNHLIGSKLLTN